MRHGKKINHLGRTASHRDAMLSNMATSLIVHKRISTTVAKAKALRKYVEPLITKSKSDTTHSRRVVFSYLQNKESAKILFDEVAEKIADRPGGYTRIIKTGNRLGDNAETCIIELVDFNELLIKEDKSDKKTRRSRRGGKKSKSEAAAKETKPKATEEKESVKAKEAATEEDEVQDAVVVEETTEEKVEAAPETETQEEKKEEKTDTEDDDTKSTKKDNTDGSN